MSGVRGLHAQLPRPGTGGTAATAAALASETGASLLRSIVAGQGKREAGREIGEPGPGISRLRFARSESKRKREILG